MFAILANNRRPIPGQAGDTGDLYLGLAGNDLAGLGVLDDHHHVFLEQDVLEILGPENKIYRDNSIKNEKRKVLSDKVAMFIKSFVPEIKLLYKEIRKIPSSKADAGKLWEEEVLKKFDEKKGCFKIVQRQDLIDKKIYQIASTNEKRDFVGKLLQKVIGAVQQSGFFQSTPE